MKKTRAEKRFINKINKRLNAKQDDLLRQAGVMGDGNGSLTVSGAVNYVYVTVADKAVPVFNNRVSATIGLKVWVGYASEEPSLFQVLSTRSDTPTGVEPGFGGYAPAQRYEWGAQGGGQDPLHVHIRAISFLKLGVSQAGGLNVNLYRGRVYSGSAFITVAKQDIDMTAYIPVTAGKAKWVLITIDNTGTVIKTAGSEVNIADLPTTAFPVVPAGTVFVSGAVRMYVGQTRCREGRTNTDIVDLRFIVMQLLSDNVFMPKVGTPTLNTLTEDFTTRGSSGVSDGTLTYVAVGTTAVKLSVAAGEGYIRTSNDQQAPLVFCKWSVSTDLYTFSAPAAGQENVIFIGIEYNAGTPQAVAKTAFSDWNWYDNFPLARVSYDGTTMRILNAYAHAEDTANLTRKWMRLNFPFHREESPEGSGGLELSVSLLALAMTAGKIWHGYNNYSLGAVASGTAFVTHYKRAGGGFVTTTGVTSYPNTQYDDASGTLATLTNNRYGTLYVFVDVSDGTLDLIYGAVNAVSVALAQADTIPTTPAHLQYHGRLIGRIIFQKSAASPTLVESAWSSIFNASAVGDHALLTNLQGGAASEYYHLTSADATEAVAFLNGGTGTHTASDAHIASTANPHSTTAAQVAAVPNDGWIPVTWSTPTRTSATVFTVAVDVSGIIRKGYKLKLTDTTTKYFDVVSATYGAGVTTITTIANSDYALVGNPSAISYSPIDSPFGFPEWFAYPATWTAVSVNPAIGDGSIVAKYRVTGLGIFAKLRVTMGSTTTYGTGNYNFGLPANAAYIVNNVALESAAGNILDNSVGGRYALAAFVRQAEMRGIYSNVILSPTTPITFASADEINLSAFYEW